MKNLARFSLRNRSLITLITIVAAVFGVASLNAMRQDLVPAIASSDISIVTSYDSATPVVVDTEVSSVIETIIESVDGLVSTTTYSGNGLSLVTAEFELGLDTTKVMEDISKKLAENSALLPDDVTPQVSGASIDDFPVMQFAVSTGDAALTTELQDSISQRIEGISGVREARFTGIPNDRMTVELDPEKSEDTGIGVRELQAAIVSGGAVEASGSLTEGERTFSVQSGKAVASEDDIKALPVPAPETGETVTVGDVATVAHMVPSASLVSRVDGEPTVVLLISKIPNANTIELSRDVRAEMREIDAEFDLGSTLMFDQSPYIEKSIETLATEGLIGLLCAVIVVFFFLTSIRTTLVTAVSIPLSLLIASIAMLASDFTVNMITLAALTVAVGRVVDDSIVVIESIEREMLTEPDRVTAIVNGVSSVAGAVMSSTLTTVAVFLPVAFIGGTIGELFRPFALTAAAAMLASLLVSLSIVPVLAYWFVRPRPVRTGTVRFEERVRSRLDAMYRPLIGRSLDRPWRVVAFSIAVLVGTAALLPGLSTGYLAPLGDTQIRVLQKLEPSTSVDAQKAKAEIIEKGLEGIDGIDRVQTSIGSTGSVLQDASLGGGGGIASYLLAMPEGIDQTAMIDEVRGTLEALPEFESLGELDYSITTDMEVASGIEIGVTALDDASLSEAVAAVTEEVESLDSVADTESTLANTVERIDVHVDTAKAIDYGLTDQEIRDAVHDAVSSTDAGSMVFGGETIDVVVLPGRTIDSPDALKDVRIETPLRGDEPLSTFATLEKVTGPTVLQSQRGLRAAVVTVEPRTDDLGATSDALAAAIDDIDLPDGADVDLGGSVTARVDAFEQMGAVSLIAILIVYTIMVATFRSLVQPLRVPSLIGVLMLVGIVVTNSIVLIDLVNQRRAAGVPLREAVLEGATRRIRPILMTAAATVFALLPMAIGLTSSSAFISRPLGLVVIGGMVSSTILTLIVLPVLYFLLERWREQHRSRRAEAAEDEEDAPRYKRTGVPSDASSSGRPAAGPSHARPLQQRPARPSIGRPVRPDRRTTRASAPPQRAPWRMSTETPEGVATAPPRRVVSTDERRSRRPSVPVAARIEEERRIDLERTTRHAPQSRSLAFPVSDRVAPGPLIAPAPISSPAPISTPAPISSPGPISSPTPLISPARATPNAGGSPVIPADATALRRRRTATTVAPQYVTFSHDEERLETATLSTWWTTGSTGRRPLLMLDPFTPHSSHGVGVAEPVTALEFSGNRLSAEQFAMAARLAQLLKEELHGYSYFAAQLVLWEILGPLVDPGLDVRVPAEDTEVVGREFQSLYTRVLQTAAEPEPALWVVTPTTPAEPRMLVAGLD
jgi:HAE1 family hydrophobic/amphiphilic exporter-1